MARRGPIPSDRHPHAAADAAAAAVDAAVASAAASAANAGAPLGGSSSVAAAVDQKVILNQPFPKRPPRPDEHGAPVVPESAGEDLGARSRPAVDEDGKRGRRQRGAAEQERR